MKVGDTVVALVTHPQGAYRKGHIYKVLALKKSCCDTVIDINATKPIDFAGIECKCGRKEDTNIWWLWACNFVPIQDVQYKTVTFKEIQEPAICAN